MFNETPCGPTVPLWRLQFGPKGTRRSTKRNRPGLFTPDHKRSFDLEIRLRNSEDGMCASRYETAAILFPEQWRRLFTYPGRSSRP